MKALLAGHISLDIRGGKKLLGGPPLYQIPILQAFGFKIDVLTSYAETDVDLTSKYPSVNFFVIKSECTTMYQFKSNKISQDVDDDRQLVLKSKAMNITLKDLDQLSSNYEVVIVSPIALEFSLNVIEELSKLGKFTFFDVQGLVRRFDSEGLVYQELNIEEFQIILSMFD
ncbi:MAG: hypothetical protein ACC656_15195, partial [Candidatus Heimdallarchaeota archaeon]